METLFENRYTITESVYDEYFTYFYFRRPAAIGGMICCAVAVLAAIGLTVFLGRLGLFSGLAFLVVILFFVFQLTGYRRARKIYYQGDLEQNGGQPVEMLLTAGPEALTSRNLAEEEERVLEYDRLKTVIETKGLFILLTSSRAPYVLKKDGFTRGTADEFRAFLAHIKKRP